MTEVTVGWMNSLTSEQMKDWMRTYGLLIRKSPGAWDSPQAGPELRSTRSTYYQVLTLKKWIRLKNCPKKPLSCSSHKCFAIVSSHYLSFPKHWKARPGLFPWTQIMKHITQEWGSRLTCVICDVHITQGCIYQGTTSGRTSRILVALKYGGSDENYRVFPLEKCPYIQFAYKPWTSKSGVATGVSGPVKNLWF